MEKRIYKSWQEAGIEVYGNHTGNFKTKCPKCSETRRNKRDKSLSVDVGRKLFNCHNCGYSGLVYDIPTPQKTYELPKPRISVLDSKVLTWFGGRKITQETLEYFKVTQSLEKMPQTNKNEKCINFNYYRLGELVNIKFRDAHKNFKLVSGAELIFYNLDSIENKEECLICEGEIDCMSWYEAGVFSAVSVPNGASKGSMKLEYLDNCWHYFATMKKIVIATDGDTAGYALREELARRLGKDICSYVEYPDGCKDANDVLVKYGKQALSDIKKNAKQYPLEGIETVLDFEQDLEEVYKNGFPTGEKIGYEQLDEHISWRGGEFTTITGIPGSGKSNFLDQVTVRLAARCGWRIGVFSPEQSPSWLHTISLIQKYVGLPFAGKKKMAEEDKEKAKAFLEDHFFFVKINEIDVTIDGILAKARELVIRKGIKGFVIDPFNYIEFNLEKGETETLYISKLLTKIKKFCEDFDVHIWLVAHPTKISKDKKTGKYEIPNLYSISGSANFFNKTYNGITIYRHYDTGLVEVHIQKVKFFFVGKVGQVTFAYDKELNTGRYAELALDPIRCEFKPAVFESEITPKNQEWIAEKPKEAKPLTPVSELLNTGWWSKENSSKNFEFSDISKENDGLPF